MKKKYIITLSLMILIPIVFFKLRDSGVFNLERVKNQKRCLHQEKAMKVTLTGEVVGKYEDKKNHNIRTLEIQDSIGKRYISTMLAVDVSGLYEKLNIGDKINKESNRLMVVFERGNRKDSIVLKFDCEGF